TPVRCRIPSQTSLFLSRVSTSRECGPVLHSRPGLLFPLASRLQSSLSPALGHQTQPRSHAAQTSCSGSHCRRSENPEHQSRFRRISRSKQHAQNPFSIPIVLSFRKILRIPQRESQQDSLGTYLWPLFRTDTLGFS